MSKVMMLVAAYFTKQKCAVKLRAKRSSKSFIYFPVGNVLHVLLCVSICALFLSPPGFLNRHVMCYSNRTILSMRLMLAHTSCSRYSIKKFNKSNLYNLEVADLEIRLEFQLTSMGSFRGLPSLT